MNREDIIRLAREAGARAQQNKNCDVEYLFSVEQIEALISHKLDEMASKVEQDFKGAFGADTCASWAAWIRGQK